MTIVNELDLTAVRLEAGGHDANDEQKWCFMEAVAFVAGEAWSDRPQCVSRTIGSFCRSLNDNLDDEGRQKLAPYIIKVIGTNTGPGDEDRRSWLIADWMTHVHLPTWLDAAGMTTQAAQVRALPKIESRADWDRARSVIRSVRDVTWARREELLEPLREKVREAVRAKLGGRDAVAAAAAAAAAVAVAAADAVAAAVAAAVADAAAAADAVAVAAAVAAAAAAAAADADAAAAADADASPYSSTWRAVYDAVKPIFVKAIKEHATVGPVAESMQASGFELLDALCAIGRDS